MVKKESAEHLIRDMKVLVRDLSLKLLGKMTNGDKIEPDEIKHLNEMKKHLKFAENIQKEIDRANGIVTKGKGSSISAEMVEKIKGLQATVGDIVRQMPTK